MAKISKVSVEFGVSISTSPSAWVKASAGMELEFEPGDGPKKDEIWEGAWDRVTDEVNRQLKLATGKEVKDS